MEGSLRLACMKSQPAELGKREQCLEMPSVTEWHFRCFWLLGTPGWLWCCGISREFWCEVHLLPVVDFSELLGRLLGPLRSGRVPCLSPFLLCTGCVFPNCLVKGLQETKALASPCCFSWWAFSGALYPAGSAQGKAADTVRVGSFLQVSGCRGPDSKHLSYSGMCPT